MYIVLLALFYLLLMMVVTAESVLKGVTVLIFGAGLIALIVYLLNAPRRSHARRMADKADQGDTRSDQ